MSNFTCYVGEQIRKYRKAGKMTLQDLADAIHKSRATVCKYENGDISVDIETLYEISQILQVSMSSLPLVFLKQPVNRPMHREKDKKAHFFRHSGYIFTFTMDAISVRRMASSIFMKKKANLENTKQP